MKRKESAAVRIAINGTYLDEVQTRLEYTYPTRALAYMRLPAHRHEARVEGDAVTLRIPTLTVMQLCFDGVIPADRSVPVSLLVEGRIEGEYLVEWLRRLDGLEHGEPVLLRLRRITSSEAERRRGLAPAAAPSGPERE
ncbi:MAG: hypothetical protein L0Y66_27205 [Myxococcaceae bacterium]|nr:hypothetical protein [Myxococcaceae bacterium]MCI0672847.1 hypothetical protein [Myxococcaceae bacterium]